MEHFLLSLSISKDVNFEDIIRPCSRILFWLHSTSFTDLSRHDLELLLKGSLFVNQFYKVFDKNLERALRNECCLTKYLCSNMFEKLKLCGCLSYTVELLMESNINMRHILFMEHFLKQFLTDDELNATQIKLLMDVSIYKKKSVTCDRDKINEILKRIFRVNPNQIDITIDRLLDNIEFNIIVHILLERDNRPTICAIVENRICTLMDKDKIKFSFFKSIYILAATSANGLQLYLKSLENSVFSNSLATYFIKFLNTIKFDEDKYIFLLNNNDFNDSDFYCMIYLVKSALSTKSPCYSNFQKNLNVSGLSDNLRNIFQMLCLVYDLDS